MITWNELPDESAIDYDGYCRVMMDVAKTTELHHQLLEQAKAFMKSKA